MENPMPLDKLSEHLRSRDITDGSLVDMGRIVVPSRPYMKWALSLSVALVFCIGSMTTYHLMSKKELTFLVDTKQPQMLSQIVADSGGEIIAVKQTEGSTYEVKVSTRKSGHSFLEWLLKNKDIKKATELEGK